MAITSAQKTDIELQFDIFQLAKSFDELIKDMYNKSFSQTIIARKNELYSDYERTNDGYLLLNNLSSIYRVEIQKKAFTNNVAYLLNNDTKKYTFNPFFSNLIPNINELPTNTNNESQQTITELQAQLTDAQNQINELLQNVNSVIADKNNLELNYDQIISKLSDDFAVLQQRYTEAQTKIENLQNSLNETLSLNSTITSE